MAIKKKQNVIKNTAKKKTIASKPKATTSSKKNPSKPAASFVVEGEILLDGKPFIGARVSAYDKDMRCKELLGKPAIADKKGRYKIAYTAKDFARAEKGSADLIVEVSNQHGCKLTESNILFNANRKETINLSVGGVSRGVPEYERLLTELTAILQGIPVHELTKEDIQFLVNDAGLDEQRIVWLIEAAKRSLETIAANESSSAIQKMKGCHPSPAETPLIAAPIFYAWFRQNIPTALSDILKKNSEILKDTLQRSSSENVIALLTAAEIAEIMRRVEVLKVNHVLTEPGDEDRAPISDLLEMALPDEKHHIIATAILEHGRSTEAFWKSVENDVNLNSEEIKSVRQTFSYGELSGDYLPLVKELRTFARKDPSFSELRGFAQFNADDWKGFLQRRQDSGEPIGHPAGYESTDDYARSLNEFIETSFPTPVIANRIKRDDSEDNPFRELKTDFDIFFNNNAEFKFRDTPVEFYLSDNPEEKLKGLENPEAIKNQLKRMERISKVAKTYEPMQALLADDIHSSQAIVLLGEKEFARRYTESFGGEEPAVAAYQQANDINLNALNLYLKIGALANAPTPYVMTQQDASYLSSLSESERANWRNFFGSLDLCDCEHCQSLYSPAAYLVDTLIFLRQGDRVGGKTPLDVFLERRPDIAQLELTCDNTNIKLPYIDLVNEILENAIAPAKITVIGDFAPADFDGGTIAAEIASALQLTKHAELVTEATGVRWAIRNQGWRYIFIFNTARTGVDIQPFPQSAATEPELGANPEHLNTAAYRKLALSGYPWSLPFNLGAEEARIYLEQLGVKRYELMEALTLPDDVLTEDAVANEYLELTTTEAQIIAGDITSDPERPIVIGNPQAYTFWGFTTQNVSVPDPINPSVQLTGSWDYVLSRVAVFLTQSRLKYKELLALLNTSFINPESTDGRMLQIVSIDENDPDTCDIAKLQITALTEDILTKIHHFVRLQRKLNWSAYDLDKAITAFNVAELNTGFLRKLSHVLRLKALLDLPVEKILSFWANINATDYIDYGTEGKQPVKLPSLYTQLFRNKAIINPVDVAFTENTADLNGTLSDRSPTIVAALRIGAADFSALTADTDVIAADVLSLENLSQLYRHAILAQKLKLSVPQLLQAKELIEIDPFDSTENTVRFAEKVIAIRNTGFTVSELCYLLRHQSLDPRIFTIMEEGISGTLSELRDGLSKIADENIVMADPKGEITHKKLSELNWRDVYAQRAVDLFGDTELFETTLTALPNGINFPEDLADRVSYVADQLRFQGVMTTTDKTALLAVTAAAGVNLTPYRDAVNQLFTDSQDAAKQFIDERMRAFVLPTFSVSSQGLPQGIAFSDTWKNKIFYDVTAEELKFVGAMTEAENAELIGLSVNATYRNAINSLFNQAKTYNPIGNNIFLTSVNDESFDDLFDSNKSVAERFQYVLEKIFSYLRVTVSENFVKQRLSEVLLLETEAIEDLLMQRLDASSDSSKKAIVDFVNLGFIGSHGTPTIDDYADQFETLLRLQKIATFVTKFQITPEQLSFISELGPDAGWIDWNLLPIDDQADPVAFAAWEKLRTALALCEDPFDKSLDLFKLIELAVAGQISETDFLNELSDATGWDADDIDVLTGTGLLNITVPDDFTDESVFARLQKCFGLMKRLGASAEQLTQWGSFDFTDSTALTDWERIIDNTRAIKNAVKAKYDEKEWMDIAKPLRDKLRDKQRPALVDYLIAHKQFGRDEVDLYDRFLIDVEMCACMITTRLKQAICSAQLFIQRCLMNLEPSVQLTAEQAKEWNEWRKQYRVWEANRKIFLYPENWIEPELRDNKSPFFKELEDELLQNDITDAAAEDAFLHYLEKLDQTARLEIVGEYIQSEPKDILHVFGRTSAIPHIYFYRKQEDNVWSAWQKVDLDIEGDHLIPVVWNRRIYLFWPIFNEKSDLPTKEQRANDDDPQKYWEIKFAWSEFKNDKWSPKKISKDFLRHDKSSIPDVQQEPKDYSFKTRVKQGINGEQLSIQCYGTTVTQSPPTTSTKEVSETITTNVQKIVTYYLPEGRANYWYWLKFYKNNWKSLLQQAEIEDIKILMKGLDGTLYQTITLSNAGEYPPSGGFATITETVDFFLESKSKQIAATNGKWGFVGGLGFSIDLMNWSPVTSTTEITIEEPGGPVSNPMQGIGEFVLDDGSGEVTRVYGPVSLMPASLEPIRGAQIQNMMMSDLNEADALGDGTMLVKTPGTFHLLGSHQAVDYTPQSMSSPFFYQDEARTYQVSQLSSGGTQIHTFYHPMIRHFIKSLNRFGVQGLLTLANQQVTAGDHFYTTNAAERDIAIDQYDYRSEGIACYVFGTQVADTTPLYRLAHTQNGDHFYTTDINERDSALQNGYQNEGVTCYVFDYQPGGALNVIPLYRLFNVQTGDHLYVTKNSGQVDAFVEFGYENQGIACYVLETEAANSVPLYRLANPQIVFERRYQPSAVVNKPRPIEQVDFDYSGTYALYNWELFFHVPFLIATQLSKNQRFEEAQKWFHYIFNPTSKELGQRERFWRVKPFYEESRQTPQTLVDFIQAQTIALEEQFAALKAHPFQPHVVARLRLIAYMKSVVMKYIDNLIAWGDQLFTRDTIESINEATQLYILAARILGKRPESIPARSKPKVKTFNALGLPLNNLSGALTEIEGFIQANKSYMNKESMPNGTGALGTLALFCLPKNDKLLGYWNTVADRLFKIRHCMNIEGVTRQLPIFEPPIDPTLLVRAAAAGIDLNSVLSDLYSPLPHYRFGVMLQKALELCADVKVLAGELLSALEKKDAEKLALLRSGHEIEVLKAVRQIKKLQVDESNETLQGLIKYQDVVTARQQYYLTRPFLNTFEIGHIALSTASLIPMSVQAGADVVAGVLHLVPNAKAGSPVTAGVTYGGGNIGAALQAFGAASGVTASMMNTVGSLSATLGGYERRQDDWTHQADLATKELEQVKKQILAAEIRLAIAEHELTNHDLQIENAKAADEFMHDKFTNQELYSWMVGQLSSVYFQSYQLAYNVAKRAERAFRYDLGLKDSNFIQFGYWDSLKKGLLAGEKLHLDLKRMEIAYHDQNKREYEITKNISLLQLDAKSLIALRQTKKCEISIPEAMFDLDFAGQYLRRIKMVSVTIPCVTGPYSGVPCTLTLLKSSIRNSSSSNGAYERDMENDDPRFTDMLGSIQSIVTSSGQNDSGLFEPNLRDERYLPFEGAGAISTWRIELPAAFPAFDYDTISDVILHIRYTARNGGDSLKKNVNNQLTDSINAVESAASKEQGIVRLFSLKHEFPSEWYRFTHSSNTQVDSVQEFTIAKNRFPFLFASKDIVISKLGLYALPKPDVNNPAFPNLKLALPGNNNPTLTDVAAVGKLIAKTIKLQPEITVDEDEVNAKWTFKVLRSEVIKFQKDIDDLLIVCHYTLG